MILSKGNDCELRFSSDTRKPEWRFSTPSPIVSADAVTLNEWHHIVGTAVPNVESVLYVDGVNKGSEGGGTAFNTADAFIGSRAAGNFLTGQIDDVIVFSTALNASEVKLLYDIGRGGILQHKPLTIGRSSAVSEAQTVIIPRRRIIRE